MKICEKCQNIYELQELEMQVHALINVLERALKCDEFEGNQDINNLYLVEIISEKFEKMSIIIHNM